jgi:hypothetical protein
MKKINILLIGLLAIAAFSCFKDESNDALRDLIPVVVDDLESRYDVYSYSDWLTISPTVQNENRYDFMWLVYSAAAFDGHARLPKADTLSLTKDLNYEVLLNPGRYILVFNVLDKETLVTEKISIDLFVSTLNMKGWYALKSHNNKTDFDYVYDGGRIDNWLKFYNGESLEGEAVKAIFMPYMKDSPTATEQYNTLFVTSEKDAGIYRIDNGTQVMNFNGMFFDKPGVVKPQNVVQTVQTQHVILINDNKWYKMTKGGRFENPPVPVYKVSPILGAAYNCFGFDDNSKSVFFYDTSMGTYIAIPTADTDLKNMNADIIWSATYSGLRSTGFALFKDADNSGRLMKLIMNYSGMQPSSATFITSRHPLPASHGLMTADVRAGNYHNDYIYYAKDNKIYLTDINTLPETLQATLPAGETVTCMQHVICPYRQYATDVPMLECFAVASYAANGRYKVWLYGISSTGVLQPLSSTPAFEGDGRVKNFIYVEEGLGNWFY